MASRILVIEDSPQSAQILAFKLSREGHAVICKRSGTEARPLLGESWDLVLLSTDVPGRESWDLMKELRASNPVPVLMILDAEEAPLCDQARALGACGVILKPFKPTVVARQVQELLEAGKETGAAAPSQDSGSAATTS